MQAINNRVPQFSVSNREVLISGSPEVLGLILVSRALSSSSHSVEQVAMSGFSHPASVIHYGQIVLVAELSKVRFKGGKMNTRRSAISWTFFATIHVHFGFSNHGRESSGSGAEPAPHVDNFRASLRCSNRTVEHLLISRRREGRCCRRLRLGNPQSPRKAERHDATFRTCLRGKLVLIFEECIDRFRWKNKVRLKTYGVRQVVRKALRRAAVSGHLPLVVSDHTQLQKAAEVFS